MKNQGQGKSIPQQDLKGLEKRIGKKIRERRLELGLTQQDLARKLDLSYQQIQKYETGTNRISAGRLYLVSSILLTKMDYFFEPTKGPSKSGKRKRNGIQFLSVKGMDTEVRMALANLLQALDN